jgi:peroxiredoxin
MKLLSVLLTGAAVVMAQPKVPRLAPEFQIVEASGHTAKLSSFRGDVVLLAFVVTTCSHCQAASKEFEKLQTKFGPRGLHVAEVAFDENGDIGGYVQRLRLTFPVGRGNRTDVLAFLGMGEAVRVGTPQVVLIDRLGIVRAQKRAGRHSDVAVGRRAARNHQHHAAEAGDFMIDSSLNVSLLPIVVFHVKQFFGLDIWPILVGL